MKIHKENQGDYFRPIRCILRTEFDGPQGGHSPHKPPEKTKNDIKDPLKG